MSVKGIKYTTYYFNIRSKRYRVSERIDEIIPETIDLTSDSDEEGKPSLSKRRTAARDYISKYPSRNRQPRERKKHHMTETMHQRIRYHHAMHLHRRYTITATMYHHAMYQHHHHTIITHQMKSNNYRNRQHSSAFGRRHRFLRRQNVDEST